MTRDWLRAAPVVEQALDLDEPARSTYLEEACAGDPVLRREIEALIALDGAAAGFLERSALEYAVQAAAVGPDARIGTLLGAYRLDALIGAGGMGEVYRARDLTLDRDVAVKVLVHAGRPDDRAMVEAEARAASRLNHQNILTVYAVGEHEGVGTIAMEFIDGETLRARLERGVMPLELTLDLAVQLGSGLAAAHRAGIVHCDLKPDNVMINRDGVLKVLDFGIARGQHARIEAVAGTAAYMSPEQAAGEAPRPLSDQFAFGVILHELLTGVHPFLRETRADTLHAIQHSTAPPVDPGRRLLPKSLSAIVSRCLEREAERRFPSMDAVVDALRVVQAEVARRPWSRRQWLTVAAAPVAVAAAASALAWHYAPWSAGRRRLAIVPFKNGSGDEAENYLSDGLTATLIERLSLLPSLEVLPRSLVFNFRGDESAPVDIARRLSAELVLSGTVTREGRRLQVTVGLADLDGRTLWSRAFDRPADELLLVQEAIATAIVDEGIRGRLNAAQRHRVLRPVAADAVAFERYLEAVALCREGSERAYLEARELLREALARDPAYGHAHVQMATTYALMAVDGLEPPIAAWPQSSRHVRRALELEPDLADAYACAASHEFSFHWDWQAAESEWRRAVRFSSADLHPDLLHARSQQRWALGRTDEALALMRDARRRDPLTPILQIREADYLLHAGQLAAAASVYRFALERSKDDPRALFGLAEALVRAGQLHDAVGLRHRAHRAIGEGAIVAAAVVADPAGELVRLDRASARLRLDDLDARAADGGYVSPLDRARELMRLERPGDALPLLDSAVSERAAGLVYLSVDRVWDPVRADRRFQAVKARVGLPDRGEVS